MKGLDEIIQANKDEMQRYYAKEACRMLGNDMQEFLAAAAVEAIANYEQHKVTIGELLIKLDKIIEELEKTL